MLVKNGLAFVDGAFIRADVRLEGGRIAEVGELEPRDGETIRDAAGLYVLPGFVDIHIHAFGGADCMRGEADVRRMSDGLLATGAGGVRAHDDERLCRVDASGAARHSGRDGQAAGARRGGAGRAHGGAVPRAALKGRAAGRVPGAAQRAGL